MDLMVCKLSLTPTQLNIYVNSNRTGLAFHLTQDQIWLVNAIAKELILQPIAQQYKGSPKIRVIIFWTFEQCLLCGS